jgi:putative CocE/NonD family hydrolase
VREAPSAAGLAPYFTDWLAHPDYDDYWKRWSIEDHYAQIQVPVFSLGAWYDIFLGGTLKNYVRLKKEAGTEAARRGQRLQIYVGGHAGGSEDRKVGAVDFGDKLPFDLVEAMLRWYDSLLKGIGNGSDREKPVRIFVMGKNNWREEDDWPLERAKATRYYLHSTKPANGLEGGGTLSTAVPAEEKPDQYVYDPNDAVPTIGGPLCCSLPTGVGPEDQRPAEARGDVLVFSSPAFTQSTEVTGPISLDLYVSSSAVDTDFTGKLVDIWPNGFAQNLTEGILRLRYRHSQEKPELGNPGEIYHICVDLWATSNVFLPGHKLRLEVSSSNFPRFDRNLNTGEDQARGTHMVKATNVRTTVLGEWSVRGPPLLLQHPSDYANYRYVSILACWAGNHRKVRKSSSKGTSAQAPKCRDDPSGGTGSPLLGSKYRDNYGVTRPDRSQIYESQVTAPWSPRICAAPTWRSLPPTCTLQSRHGAEQLLLVLGISDLHASEI